MSGLSPIPRKDLPEDEWAGRWVTSEDVANAHAGDVDLFTVEERLKAHRDANERYNQARPLRNNADSGYEFAQIMLIGGNLADMTAMACCEAYKWWQRGHTVFHNGQFTFGRVVTGDVISDISERVPRHSIIVLDDEHVGFMASSVRSFVVMCARIRQFNCRLLLMPSEAAKVPSKVRQMASDVWRLGDIDQANHVIAWDEWSGFPFRDEDLDGFGPPDMTRETRGDAVRNALVLTSGAGA